MKHQEFTLKAYDETELFAQIWEPPVVSPRAVICLVHGLGEHTSRYAHVADAFSKDGFILFGFDLRGHGRSGGARGHMNSIEDFMRDIDLLLKQARTLYPNLPILLYGHSLGGILTLHYSLTRKPQVKGVVVTSPGLRTAVEKQPIKKALAQILGSVLPTVSLPSGLDPNGISRDKSVVETYLKDPLVHDRLSLGFGKNMIAVIAWTLAHAGEFSLPLLMLHGKQDEIAYPSGSSDFAATLKDRCTLILWDGAYHELHNEPEKHEVLKTITMWVDARLRD